MTPSTCWTSTRCEPANLLKACTALEVVTEDAARRRPARSSSGSATATSATRSCTGSTGRRSQGPLGYGPSSPDPETGEIISASAYIYGAALDTYAKFAVDSVRLANGQLDTDDLLSGKTISDVLAETPRGQPGAHGRRR